MYKTGEIIYVSNLEDGIYSKRIFLGMSEGEGLIQVVKKGDELDYISSDAYDIEFFNYHKKYDGRNLNDLRRRINITAIPDFAQKTKKWYKSYTILCTLGMYLVYALDKDRAFPGYFAFLVFWVGAILFRIDADEKLI
ncbi:MAG: hypothetical protein E6Q36_01160 [Chryseobacterium sp.]|nr:MAG: hypothetical protein E6Q36_01160 [Chryseobacterium sp.]